MSLPKGPDPVYAEFENEFRDLYNDLSGKLSCVDEDHPIRLHDVIDVPVSEFRIVEGRDAKIGTKGLSSCVAICAQGKSAKGEPVLGLLHYSGFYNKKFIEPKGALELVISEVSKKTMEKPEIWLIGGYRAEIQEDEDDYQAGTIDRARGLVDNYKENNIKGVNLNCNDVYTDCPPRDDGKRMEAFVMNSVNVVITPESVFYRRKDLY